MNRYYIEVVMNDKKYTRVVEATNIAWSESGLYEFWQFNEDGKKVAIAYYPVNRTIIEKIEYNIND